MRFSPWLHFNLFCLEPAPRLVRIVGPGPMAAVSVSLAQPPDVEIGTLEHELFIYLFTTPALVEGLGQLSLSEVTTRIVGMLNADSTGTGSDWRWRR